ncbi:CarD family transcriptional regulator [Myxococcota bacterium]|nr:CarD family transcriptional regulator [Myxococcota bacterium]MBU1429208.1 CarD family transcriptional regulator [Myxococcota bacterium]MBU1898508.1 CarD family transcriptional regulator [Myxococcota bacterium]
MITAFNVGDMAVYPAQGVTEILGIETLEISGITNQFYVLRCLDSEKKIRVPLSNVDQVGLRNIVETAEIEEVLGTLRAEEVAIEEPNWNRRYRRYVEKIQTGSLVDVAQVLRDLHLTRFDKQLSYGEKRVYEMAMQLLVQELAIAKHLSEEEITQQVEQLLG